MDGNHINSHDLIISASFLRHDQSIVQPSCPPAALFCDKGLAQSQRGRLAPSSSQLHYGKE
uniref:Uncharacterized protein n=1 Tax=Arundo donax TaxID=35708 RepID=A0A0A9GA29_ARUDO